MKYLLGIGFVVTQKYKKDPIVRVNIDDTFIDEFTLSEYPNYDKKWMLNMDPWIYKAPFTDWDKHRQPWLNLRLNLGSYPNQPFPEGLFPKKFKLYLLDTNQLKDKDQLIVDIVNSDSNYTNGFMTKSTLLDFQTFLIPVKFLKFFYHDGFKIKKEFNNCVVDKEYDGENFFDNPYTLKGEKRYYMISNKLDYNQKFFRRLEGYPFSFNNFWNNKPLDKWSFGGSGKLTVNLLTKQSGTVMFDPYDKQFSKLQKDGKVDQSPGFYISQKFFSMVHKNMFDKYLYNENH